MTDPAESMAAIGREWLSIGGSTMSKLRDLQLKRMNELRETGMTNMQKFFASGDPDSAMKIREELLAQGWQEHMAFMKSAVDIFDGAWQEMQEAVKTHAEVATDEAGKADAAPQRPTTLSGVPNRPTATFGIVFELYKDRAGEFRFRLNNAQGECVLRSEGYKARGSAENGIASIMKNAPNDARYERTQTSTGQHMFNLKAGNHQVIGTSGGFASSSEMEDTIRLLQSGADSAVTKDLTERAPES